MDRQRWALRFTGGELAIFQACDTPEVPCALISIRDHQGKVVRFHRDARGALRTIEAGTEQLRFEYDDKKRIVRAVQGPHEATYSYDDRGRLVRSTVSGVARSFRYGSRDEMIAIEEPNQSIENTYDDALRVIRQVVRRPGRAASTYSFAYAVYDKAIVETAVTWPNGSRTTYRWNENRRQDLEIHEGSGDSPIMVQFARADGVFTGLLTISCTNDGRPVTETVEVYPGQESRVKAEVIERICSG
jgi:YD repeat-containing protein